MTVTSYLSQHFQQTIGAFCFLTSAKNQGVYEEKADQHGDDQDSDGGKP